MNRGSEAGRGANRILGKGLSTAAQMALGDTWKRAGGEGRVGTTEDRPLELREVSVPTATELPFENAQLHPTVLHVPLASLSVAPVGCRQGAAEAWVVRPDL